ncbi:MAG: hypothetical protein EOM54_09220 [Clostridia bacterium]|nr:hypothetical protein [Clostridia bacterium]NCC69786.1 hypothetical protein [Clostridia bacterium]
MHEGHHYHERKALEDSPEMRKALMEYLLGHNRSHTRELEDLGNKLEKAGDTKAAEAVRESVSCFEKGGTALELAVSLLEEH